MKREDVKAKIPGITDEQLNWLMSENGADINREKTVAEQFKTQFENTQAQLKTAQDGLAKFDGKKTPDEYEAELTKLRGDMQAQADGFAFDSALNTAIMGKKGRSVKAVRALLDMEALKSSKDRTTDIDKALEEAAKANPWAFGEAAEGGSVHVSSGAEHGTPPTGDTDAVTYEGSPKAGSVKVPVRDTEVTVNDYNKQTGAELTGGDTTYLTVNIDKDKAVNEIIDGFDAASVPDDLVADRLDSAGYSLALQVDSDGSAELTTAGTAFGTTTALTEKTIYGNVVDARTKLSTVHVPTEGRWLLVSPEIYGLLLKSPEFIKASDLGDAVVQTGAVGRIAGFTVFEDSTLGEGVEYIAGHPNWFAFIDEWAVPVHVQDLNGSSKYIGASAVKGRKVYAFKVTKPKTILIKKKA